MQKLAIAAAALALLMSPVRSGSLAWASEPERTPETGNRALVVRDAGGSVLTSVPLTGRNFAVSYRNSIYGTPAEERYAVLPDGRYRLVEIAADQLAVLEEYYAVPDVPQQAPTGDRREWTVQPDPANPLILKRLSIAATDRGERTLHVPGQRAVPLWPLVEDDDPFVVLDIEEAQ